MTNQGIYTVVNGDIGTTGASTLMTGFHDPSVVVGGVPQCTYTETPLNVGLVNGTIDTTAPSPTAGCPLEGTATTFTLATQAASEAQTAYNTLTALPAGSNLGGELGGLILPPGVYASTPGTFAITAGPLTLDAQGDPNSSWVFQMATSLTVGSPSFNESVILINGAQASNVYWQVGSAAAINGILGGGTMVGTVIAQAGITVSTAGVAQVTTIDGRLLSLGAAVTVVNTVIVP
jgi:hypothetical protein